MADSIRSVSSTTDPYTVQSYSAAQTDRNTLSITSYFKLLSAELANQDMSNPMDTSDMMNQMSQMAMVQSLTAMTESLKNSQTLSHQSYAASMAGRTVRYTATDEVTGKLMEKTGVVTGVNLSGGAPTFQIEGETADVSLEDIVAVLDGSSSSSQRTAADTLESDLGTSEKAQKSEKSEETEETGKAEEAEKTAETGKTEESEETAETKQATQADQTEDGEIQKQEEQAADARESTAEEIASAETEEPVQAEQAENSREQENQDLQDEI
jgi:flagellar basal-body rod modification protein FlgD